LVMTACDGTPMSPSYLRGCHVILVIASRAKQSSRS
jgi:hypothetical protein